MALLILAEYLRYTMSLPVAIRMLMFGVTAIAQRTIPYL
jgi:hypothetical protein